MAGWHKEHLLADEREARISIIKANLARGGWVQSLHAEPSQACTGS